MFWEWDWESRKSGWVERASRREAGSRRRAYVRSVGRRPAERKRRGWNRGKKIYWAGDLYLCLGGIARLDTVS